MLLLAVVNNNNNNIYNIILGEAAAFGRHTVPPGDVETLAHFLRASFVPGKPVTPE